MLDNFILDFSKHLKKLKVDHVNSGGCGFVAIFIYEYLISLGLDPQIYRIDDSKISYQDNTYYYQNNIPKSKVGKHYLIKLDNFYLDANGAFDVNQPLPNYENNTLTQISKEELLWTIRYGNWNEKFKIHNSVYVVSKIKNYIFSFKKQHEQLSLPTM